MGLSPVGNEKNEVEQSPESGFKARSGFMCVLKRDLTAATLQLLPQPGQCMEAVREKHGSDPAWQLTLAVQSPAAGRASSSQRSSFEKLLSGGINSDLDVKGLTFLL